MSTAIEELRANPRKNADAAYAAFMSMPDAEWRGLLMSLASGGVLEVEENKGFERAIKERTNQPNGEIITSGNGQEPIVFSVTAATIKPMADRYLKLRVNGIDDKAGLKTCHEARMACVKARTTCEKEHKREKESAKRECDRIDQSRRDLLALIAPIEKHLEQQEDAVAKELARIEQEKLDALIDRRVEILRECGAALMVGSTSLGLLTDDAFELMRLRVVEDTRQSTELAEAARIERERMAAERETLDREIRDEKQRLQRVRESLDLERWKRDEEAARLKKIEDDRLAAAQADLDRQRAAIAAENKRLADEAERKRQVEDRERITREVAEQTRIETENRIAREAEAAEHRIELLRKAALRAESLKPDKEKLLQVATWLANLEMPEVSAESFDLAQSVHAVVYRACGEIRSMLELAQ